MTSLANENTSMHTARQVESIFKTHAETPVVTSGSLFAEPGSNMVKIKVYQSQKDLINDKIEKQYLEHIVRRDNAEKLNGRKFSVLLSNTIPSPLGCIYETTSPDGQYLVKLICIVNEDGKKKYFFDVYGSNKRLHRMALDKYHNDVILKHPFHNGFSWAPPSKGIDFQTLVYIAERKPSVDDPQNNATVLKLFQEDKKKNENKVYDTTEYEYEDDYGEQLETVQRPTPYVLRFDTTKCSILNIVDPTQQNMAFGTPVFMPNKKGIVCTGWENIKLRRHGIIYYNTRPSKLYRIDVDLNLVSRPGSSNVRSITNDVETDYSCCNPSFIGNSLIYLTTMKTQRHNSASRLKRIEYDPTRDQFVCDQQNILIDVEPFTKSVPVSSTGEIDTTEDTETGTFSGIYDRGTWPAKQLYLSNDIMAFSSSNRSCMDIYFYDLRNLSLSQFEIPKFLRASKDEGYACRVLACQDNLMLWTFSKRNMMERLFVSDTSLISSEHVTLSSPESIMKSKSIRTITLQAAHFENAEFSKAIHHIKSEVITLEKDDICYQGILSYRPSENLDEDDDTQLPLVAMPHGGPHSNIIANYDSVISFLNSVGFGVLCLNYRGSLAYGTASEESLPGYIGQNDVFDCHSLINFTLSKYKHIFDSNNVFVVGGSHGGS